MALITALKRKKHTQAIHTVCSRLHSHHSLHHWDCLSLLIIIHRWSLSLMQWYTARILCN